MKVVRWLCALAFGLVAVEAQAQTEPLALRLDFLPSGYHTPIFLALENGGSRKPASISRLQTATAR